MGSCSEMAVEATALTPASRVGPEAGIGSLSRSLESSIPCASLGITIRPRRSGGGGAILCACSQGAGVYHRFGDLSQFFIGFALFLNTRIE